MSQLIAELRKAAASARAFADNLDSPELRRSFKSMARRWELEAQERESREMAGRSAGQFESSAGSASARKH